MPVFASSPWHPLQFIARKSACPRFTAAESLPCGFVAVFSIALTAIPAYGPSGSAAGPLAEGSTGSAADALPAAPPLREHAPSPAPATPNAIAHIHPERLIGAPPPRPEPLFRTPTTRRQLVAPSATSRRPRRSRRRRRAPRRTAWRPVRDRSSAHR